MPFTSAIATVRAARNCASTGGGKRVISSGMAGIVTQARSGPRHCASTCAAAPCRAIVVAPGASGANGGETAMWQYVLKIAITALVVVAVAEIAKRSTVWAAALASLPLTSLLAFIWLYLDSRNVERVAAMSQSIFWLVIPSLLLFVLFPVLLRAGWGFWLSLASASIATAGAYALALWLLAQRQA